MTSVRIAPAEDPAVWRASDIGGHEAFVHRLSSEQIGALNEAVHTLRDTPIAAITRDSFSSPALDALMAAARDAILNGRGAMLLSGLDIRDWSVEDFERAHWYLGTHIGRGLIQSGKGDLIGHVRHVTSSRARGYTSDAELRPHTDYHDVLSLACYRPASSGGESGVTSALAVHNALLEVRSDLLEALYEGYYNGLPFRYGLEDNEHSQRRVPYFSRAGGRVSAFTLSFPQDAAAQRGEPIPEKFVEAIAEMRKIASAPGMQARFMLQSGEMLFWNNRALFHARDHFINTDGNERLLLRLWIDVPGARPLHPEVKASADLVIQCHERGLDQRETQPA